MARRQRHSKLGTRMCMLQVKLRVGVEYEKLFGGFVVVVLQMGSILLSSAKLLKGPGFCAMYFTHQCRSV